LDLMKRRITIAGAGIAGLTAAINLARWGYDVVVYERSKNFGGRFIGDFQHLENWTYDKDVLEVLKDRGLEINFPYCPVKRMFFYTPSLKEVVVESRKPLFYAIRRGCVEYSIDNCLGRQALDAGVEIRFNSKINRNSVDIDATGPKKVSALGVGILFDTNLEDRVSVIFDDRISPKSYAYFEVFDGKAALVASMVRDFKNGTKYLERTLERFKEILDFKILNAKKFSGFVYYNIPESARVGKRLLVGEAAGFQDWLAGFGMLYAVESGFLAAKSIAENKDYDELWKEELLCKLKSSKVNRFLFELLGNIGYSIGLNIISFFKPDLRNLLRMVYIPNVWHSILYPVASVIMRKRFS